MWPCLYTYVCVPPPEIHWNGYCPQENEKNLILYLYIFWENHHSPTWQISLLNYLWGDVRWRHYDSSIYITYGINILNIVHDSIYAAIKIYRVTCPLSLRQKPIILPSNCFHQFQRSWWDDDTWNPRTVRSDKTLPCHLSILFD